MCSLFFAYNIPSATILFVNREPADSYCCFRRTFTKKYIICQKHHGKVMTHMLL